MARKGRSGRGARKSGKNVVWATILNENVTVLAGATKTGTDIVSDLDWTVISGARRGTIMRVRGWYSVQPVPTAGVYQGGSVMAYVGVYDKDELSVPAVLPNTYIDEDIMATWGHQFPEVATGDHPATWGEVIDIKAMRKIRTGQELRFVLTNAMTDPLLISLVIRALVKIDS